MDLENIPVTRDGFDALNGELNRLRNKERPEVIAAIAEARGHGDLKENAEYHAARERQGLIEALIAELEDKLSRAQVVEPKGAEGTVRFGAWVVLADEETGEEKRYRIVGELEADISRNLLSISSPMARALLGKRTDDLVEIRVPKGTREFSIVEVEYS